MIHSEKKNGILRISSPDHFARFYFKRGGIVFVDGDLVEDLTLGALLRAENLIEEQDIQEAVKLSQASNKRLGMILLEQEIISKEDLVRTLQYQFKEAAARVLAWKEGRFEYKDGLGGLVEDIPLEMDSSRLMAEAEKWMKFREVIPNDGVVFRINDTALESASFPAEGAHRVMLMMDGTRSVADIIRETGMPRIRVYKAIKTLFLRGAIKREGHEDRTVGETTFSKRATMQFFLWLVGEIMADLAMELGKKKTDSILDGAVRASSHSELFTQTLRMGEATETNLKRMNVWLVEQQKEISSTELYNDFKSIAAFLLKEECRLLGQKSFQSTMERLAELSKSAPQEEKRLAISVINDLNTLNRVERGSTGADSSFSGLTTTNSEMKDDTGEVPFPTLGQIGGAAIIAFYSRIIQIAINDLSRAIGSKSYELIQKIANASSYYEKFISQFNVKDDVKTNVDRIRTHISQKGYRLSKKSFINGFQQVLMALLLEEKDLLGEKAALATIGKLESVGAGLKQKEFKYLTEHLMQTIRLHGGFDD